MSALQAECGCGSGEPRQHSERERSITLVFAGAFLNFGEWTNRLNSFARDRIPGFQERVRADINQTTL